MRVSAFLDMTKEKQKINILHVSEHEGEDALEVNALLMQKDMKSHYCYVKSLTTLYRGEDCIEIFLKTIQGLEREIRKELEEKKPITMTENDWYSFKTA